MDEYSLPRKAYLMLYNLNARGKRNWASNVRMHLFQYGFGFVWMNQSVGGVSELIGVFRERLIDCRWQNWEYIMSKLMTDFACTEHLIAVRTVPTHI